jgi:hypothetical protein
MNIGKTVSALLTVLALFTARAGAQDRWPRDLISSDGSLISIYEPQPESFRGDILKERAAFSVTWKGAKEPVFGTFWSVAIVETDRDNRIVHILSVKVPNLRMARDSNDRKISYLRNALESGIPTLNIDLSLDALLASLDLNTEEKSLSKGLKNSPPRIIYETRPSLLVLIDGQPMIQHNNDLGMDAVVNTPYTILKSKDGNFYLYGGNHWYKSSLPTGPYAYTPDVPYNMEQVRDAVDDASFANAEYTDSSQWADTAVSDIIVSTGPAELIQSTGDPVFAPIAGTQLEYVSNSDNDIFLDSGNRRYYVLLSGRWYTAAGLQGGWQYIASDSLPADFAKIQEGSPKDNVLASVAGSNAAKEAVMDAQIPQTAKVDRKNAKVEVTYDGSPQFQDIPGTHLQYAVNTPNTVISYKGRYYCVDKGVWFESAGPNGPWQICTRRPDDLDLIPPSCPVYNLKYVYIYDVDPDWVYMGYTPGYLNTFIYGPTVVFGTGFYYMPWRGHYFYPRPWTWGFNMWYDPWLGWTFGFDYSWDWYNWGIGFGWGFWYGGWWGPWIYRPPYIGRGFYHNGFYGGNSFVPTDRFVNYNNIYRNRPDVINRETSSRILTDRDGNVYRRNERGEWEQRQGGTWRPVENTRQRQNLERQEQQHTRGQIRTQNFHMSRGGIFGGMRSGSRGARSGGGRR